MVSRSDEHVGCDRSPSGVSVNSDVEPSDVETSSGGEIVCSDS
jgi:hypothetical protein